MNIFKRSRELERRIKKIEDDINLKKNKKKANKLKKYLYKNVEAEYSYEFNFAGLNISKIMSSKVSGKLISISFNCTGVKLMFEQVGLGNYKEMLLNTGKKVSIKEIH